MTPSELCESLRSSLSALFECSVAPQGAVRIRTPFMYPDGDMVDVFVEERGASYLMTDYGEAMGWLHLQSPSENLTPKQRRMAADVCLTLGVELDRGQLVLRNVRASAVSEAVHSLGQAVVRVCDIWFTVQTRAVETIGDQVDEWLRERSFDFDKNKQHSGESGRVWTVDYEVSSDHRTSLVFLLSTGTQAWARRLSERVVAACTDLSSLPRHQPNTGFVSLFDDTSSVWRDEDFALVERHSQVATWSRPEEFESILTTDWAPPPLLSVQRQDDR